MKTEDILNEIKEVKEKKNMYLSFSDFNALSKKEGFIYPYNKTYGIYKGVEIHGDPYVKDGEVFNGTSQENINRILKQMAEYRSKLSWCDRMLDGLFI